MTFIEQLHALEIDADATLARFGGNEALLAKFLKKFLDDPSYSEVQSAWEQKQWDALERAAHTLKGVAGNLGMTRLFSLSNEMVQRIRRKEQEGLEKLYAELETEYSHVIAGLSKCGF